MTTVNVAVLYESAGGAPRPAVHLARAAQRASADVRLRAVEELTATDVVWADVLLLGSASSGSVTSRLERVLDAGAGKVCAGFTPGQEGPDLEHLAERCVEIAYRLKVGRAA